MLEPVVVPALAGVVVAVVGPDAAPDAGREDERERERELPLPPTEDVRVDDKRCEPPFTVVPAVTLERMLVLNAGRFSIFPVHRNDLSSMTARTKQPRKKHQKKTNLFDADVIITCLAQCACSCNLRE